MNFREHTSNEGWSDWELASLAVDIRSGARYGGMLKAEVKPRMREEFTADEVRRIDAPIARSVAEASLGPVDTHHAVLEEPQRSLLTVNRSQREPQILYRFGQGNEPEPIRVRALVGCPCLEQRPHALPARSRGEARQEERLITAVLTELADQDVSLQELPLRHLVPPSPQRPVEFASSQRATLWPSTSFCNDQ